MQQHVICGKNKKAKAVWTYKEQKTCTDKTQRHWIKLLNENMAQSLLWRKVVAIKGEHFKNTKQWFCFADWCKSP